MELNLKMNYDVRKSLWDKRDLIWHLALTDLKIRYKNSILGFGWTIFEPLLMLTVFYLVFTNIFKTGIENFALYLIIGIVVWNMFARGTTMNTVSILNKSNIVTKLFFPREILIVSTTITAFLMMVFEFAIIGAFFIGSQFLPPLSSLMFIPILGILFILTLGVSLALSVLNVKLRDVGVIWTVIIHAGFFLTPIIYRIDFLPENIQIILLINPLTHFIEAAHNLMLYGVYPDILSILYMIISSFVILIIGITIFRKYNPDIVEKL